MAQKSQRQPITADQTESLLAEVASQMEDTQPMIFYSVVGREVGHPAEECKRGLGRGWGKQGVLSAAPGQAAWV